MLFPSYPPFCGGLQKNQSSSVMNGGHSGSKMQSGSHPGGEHSPGVVVFGTGVVILVAVELVAYGETVVESGPG